MDEAKNTNVYVSGSTILFIYFKLSDIKSWILTFYIWMCMPLNCHLGLPENTTEEEFVEFMSKCGIIMEDNDTS